jgi:hypothetical protein
MHNFELLDCKFEAKVELDQYFNTMLDACMVQCDQELLPLEARIAELKALMLSTDQQIPHVGPDVKYRNREVQQMLYPHPPVCLYFRSPLLLCFSHFFTNTHFLSLSSRSILIMSFRVWYYSARTSPILPYQDAYTTDAERSAAVSRDKRAQRAVWNVNLRLLEVKKSVLKKKGELLTSLWEEFMKVSKEKSDLGSGYANYQYAHLA